MNHNLRNCLTASIPMHKWGVDYDFYSLSTKIDPSSLCPYGWRDSYYDKNCDLLSIWKLTQMVSCWREFKMMIL